jgi:hypothetical protein
VTGRIFFYILAAGYPVLMFCFLSVFKAPPRLFSLFVAAFALAFFIAATSKKKRKSPEPF